MHMCTLPHTLKPLPSNHRHRRARAPRSFVSRAHAGGKGSGGGGGSDLTRHQQFLFLNGRPVDLPRVNKALNDTYRCVGVAGCMDLYGP